MSFEKQAMGQKENVYNGFLMTTFLCMILVPFTGDIASAGQEK